MCGIGLVLNESRSENNLIISSLNRALSHRGPDSSNSEIIETNQNKYVGLVHTRLSIIDLSERASQPMKDLISGNRITFNGEIYNYQEIKRDLEQKGEVFFSNSDTEVLLVGYRVYGFKELLNKLRGMFAFIIWDEQKQKIFAARDPLGIKPLYFTNEETILISSEVSALKKTGLIKSKISNDAINSYLAYGSVQPPLTIFEGIFALLPGHYITISLTKGVSEQRQYFSWKRSRNEFINTTRKALNMSIKRHLVSDVPIGILLSGGFDSTAIASLASKYSKESLTSFTMNFTEYPEMSELKEAKLISERLGLDHKIINIRKEQVISLLPEFYKSMDQPSEDGLNIFLISRFINKAGIKVCLHGAGGDEIFGGYPSFYDVPLLMKLKYIPQTIKSFLSIFFIGNGVFNQKMNSLLKSDSSLLEIFLLRRTLMSSSQRKKLFNYESKAYLGTTQEWLSMVQEAIYDKSTQVAISTLELLQYSSNKLMVDGDVMSMANGVELRVPFLDIDLVKSAHQLNKSIPNRSYMKSELVDSVKDFPIDLINRSKKGFTLPIKHWLKDLFKKDLERSKSALISKAKFNAEALDLFFEKNNITRNNQNWLRVWQLFVLGIWLDENI